jgi:hypothetical protein
MRFSELAADLSLEEAGVWVPYNGDVEFRVASASSKRAVNAYRKFMRPVERRIATGSLRDEEATTIIAKFIVHGLLIDWKGVDDDKGKPLPFSVAAAEQALALPEMKYVRKFIQDAAGEQDVFKATAIAEDVAALKSV